MSSKKTGAKVDWLREMREKQFDERSRQPSKQPDRPQKQRGDKKGDKG